MKKAGIAILGILLLSWAGWRVWLSRQDPSVQEMIENTDTLELLRMAGIVRRKTHDNGTWGRREFPGRGHSPWVFRSNLDGRIRMVQFALAPDVWLSYDTQRATPYQFWRGEIVLQGPVYDSYHGLQPVSRGNAWLMDEGVRAWSLLVDGVRHPAEVEYLGHFEREGGERAGIRFRLRAAGEEALVTEIPELSLDGDRIGLRRELSIEPSSPGVQVIHLPSYRTQADGERGETPLPSGASVLAHDFDEPAWALSPPDEEELQHTVPISQRLMDESDCVTCHGPTQKTVGPSWREIALRYAGDERQATAARLAGKILEGSTGIWGPAVMTPHPQLSRREAEQMAAQVLAFSSDAVELEDDPFGGRYSRTFDYDVEPRLTEVHPSYDLERIRPEGFRPMAGAMDWAEDGSLLVSTWDEDGSVYRVSGFDEGPERTRVTRIAEGLQEPLGLARVGDRLFVLQKQELTELIDTDGDGRIDEYRTHNDQWGTTANFHEFAFGLVHRGDHLYATLSVCVLNGGASCPNQDPDRGSVVRFHLETGEMETVATGLRTPNGLGLGPEGQLFVTDNQGDWLPASKLQPVAPGAFFGWRPPGKVTARQVSPPALWLPQDEIGNSPSEPVLLTEGPFAGQMLFGDVYQGGIQRAFLERVNGVWQGAVFRFTGGLEGSANRLLLGAGGGIFVGEIGNPGNWGVPGKEWFGLERLRPNGHSTFELLEVRARAGGFEMVFSEPVADAIEIQPGDVTVKQWFYHATAQYGGPKYDTRELPVTALRLGEDRRRILLEVDGLARGHVVHLHVDPRVISSRGDAAWVHEAWYTLNELPPVALPR